MASQQPIYNAYPAQQPVATVVVPPTTTGPDGVTTSSASQKVPVRYWAYLGIGIVSIIIGAIMISLYSSSIYCSGGYCVGFHFRGGRCWKGRQISSSCDATSNCLGVASGEGGLGVWNPCLSARSPRCSEADFREPLVVTRRPRPPKTQRMDGLSSQLRSWIIWGADFGQKSWRNVTSGGLIPCSAYYRRSTTIPAINGPESS